MVNQQVLIEGNSYQFVAFKNPKASDEKGELVLLLATLQVNKKRVAAIYSLRWEIECMFKHLKSNGFHLKDLSMIHEKKTRFMVALLVAAYTCCVCEGINWFHIALIKTVPCVKNLSFRDLLFNF